MLGYKPFFKEYTTDWDFAVAKMKGSFFQRHLVEDAYREAKSWPEQVEMSSGPKPTNAEFEQWTTDMNTRGKADGKMNGFVNGHRDAPKVNDMPTANGKTNGFVNGYHGELKQLDKQN